MILCCGEALIDMIPDVTASGQSCMVPKTGGAVFNTAIALGRLGVETALFTGVSDDMFGRQIASELAKSNVGQDHLVKLGAPTSLAFVELNDGNAQYTFYTTSAADTSLEVSHLPTNLESVDAVFFGGISLCTDPTASTLQTFMKRASDAGIVTMIDPNIRPSFIQDEITYRARLQDMMQIADIVKLSDEDLAWVARADTNVESQIASLNLRPDTLLLITKGADGATVFRNGAEILTAPSVPATVIDTIGAGDTFNAGILADLSKRGFCHTENIRSIEADTLGQIVAFANKCAAITVSRQGANPPTIDQLN